jgi:hypothetical protein
MKTSAVIVYVVIGVVVGFLVKGQLQSGVPAQTAVPAVSPVAQTVPTPSPIAAPIVAAPVQPAVPAPTAPTPPVEPVSKLGPAGQAVETFFRNLEFERYREMWAQTVHSRNEDVFVDCLKTTPIRCTNYRVVSEEREGENWSVTVAADLTEVTSAFAACMINTQIADDNEKVSRFKFKPAMLGIEEMAPFRQQWRVIKLDNRYLIDLGAGESKVERHSNFMNYVLDAARIVDFGATGKDSENSGVGRAAAWLTIVAGDLGLTQEQSGKVIENSVPLFKQGMIKLKEFLAKAKELTQERNNKKVY